VVTALARVGHSAPLSTPSESVRICTHLEADCLRPGPEHWRVQPRSENAATRPAKLSVRFLVCLSARRSSCTLFAFQTGREGESLWIGKRRGVAC